MKKVVLITFFMTAVLTAGLAQFTDQGTILLGGSTSASINFITEKVKWGDPLQLMERSQAFLWSQR